MTNTLFDNLLAPHQGSARLFATPRRGGPISYSAFLDMSARLANLFEDIGVGKGNRIAVQVAKSIQALAIYAACVRVGAALLPLNTAYTAEEVAYFIGDAQPRLMIAGGRAAATLAEITDHHRVTLLTLEADGSGTLTDAAAAMATVHEVRDCGPEDLAAILYTSGTTRALQGRHAQPRQLAVECAGAGRSVALHGGRRAAPRLADLPHAWAVRGGQYLPVVRRVDDLHESFASEALIEALPRATTLMGVPTFYTRLLQEAAFNGDLVRHMRLFVSGSAPLLAETHEAFAARTGHRILERYGMTETNMNASNPYEGARKAGTVGPPLPGTEIVITDPDTGAILPQGEVGMIEVRGPNVFHGYWRMPEKTAAELRANGFFITGDLGRFDEHGYLAIVGRQKDLIISGGYNIYPKEIELLIDEMPGVAESAVYGVPDADFGEAVVAAVVSTGAPGITAEEIMLALRPKLARFKQPKRIFFVDDLPRNTMGKVQKNVLRETPIPPPDPTS